MGQRANFIVIKDGKATAYEDNWAGLGCVHDFAAGLEHATAALKEYEQTDTLMDWAFAEGGYLIDHDQKTAIVFGESMDRNEMMEDILGIDFEEEFGELLGEEAAEQEDPPHNKLSEGDYLGFLQDIADGWKGWTIRWDHAGVDSFSEHLKKHNITNIHTAPINQPEDLPPTTTHQA